MMKLCKLIIAMWISLPQFKGEFFLYHFLEAYILHLENYMLNLRMTASSAMVTYAFKTSHYVLESCMAHISGECILDIERMAEKACDTIEKEIQQREKQNEGAKVSQLNRRDTVILNNYGTHKNELADAVHGQGPTRSPRQPVQDFSRPQNEREMMNKTMQPRHQRNYDPQEMMQTATNDDTFDHRGFDPRFDDVPLNQSINFA
jgi:hypothetical protein